MISKTFTLWKGALLFLVCLLCGGVGMAQTYTFTAAGATGINGPTQAQVNSAYAATPLAGNVTVAGGIQSWTVPVAGLYKIEVYGANGYGPYGGRGAYMSGEFTLNAADVLKILVGQQGGCCVGSGTQQYGGGGGSFVVTATNTPLIIAGGGGGANGVTSIQSNSDASVTLSGNNGAGSTSGAGGTNGSGGAEAGIAGGGGGFSGDGGGSPHGGKSFLNGGQGGTAASSGGWGGFGGGGGANSWDNRRGGGGGGYSGGGGAGSSTGSAEAGGGGGSYNSGANQVNTPALGTGSGQVIITLLAPAVSVPDNAGITGFPSLSGGLCAGNQTVSVKVRNFGNNPIDSVKIAWEIDGVLQNESWYQVNLDTFPVQSYETTVVLGTYNFPQGTSVIRAWTSLPNNQADTVHNNDTGMLSLTTKLAGVYTLNAAQSTGGTNYQSFTDFASALNTYGVCGPFTLNVVSGSGPYNEQIAISEVDGASAANTITINGNGATISFSGTSSAPWTVGLDGADYVTINDLNISGTGSSYALALHLWNQADHNSFNNCTLSVPLSGTSTTQVPFSISGSATSATSGGSGGDSNLVSGCVISGGYYNTILYGASGMLSSGNRILNSTLKEFYVYGVYAYYQNGLVLSGNTIERPTRSAVSTFYGTYLATGNINMLIENNIIRKSFGGSPGSSNTGYGMYISSAASAGNENRVINNVIYGMEGNGTEAGLYLTGATYIRVYHNTISLDYANATTGTTYGIYATGTAGVDLKNNIVSVTRGGSGTKYCLYFSGSGKTSDYNDLYITPSPGTHYTGYYATGFASLANWQGANSGAWDQNSLNVDPLFVNALNGDLTPANGTLDNKGTPVGVTTDISGAARDALTPDIGAFEFAVPPCNGVPVAGTAFGDALTCPNSPITLNDTGFTVGAGIAFQWEYSPAGFGMWDTISGAHTPSFVYTAGITQPTDFRLAVTCVNGGAVDYSNVFTVNMGQYLDCYCSPLNGTALHGTTGNYITRVQIPGTTLDNPTTAVGPGGYLKTDPSVPSQTADLVQGQSYTLEVAVSSASYTSELWIDWDQSGTFDASEYTQLPNQTSVSYTLQVPVSAVAGMTGMRLRNVASSSTLFGAGGACDNISVGRETEDYFINVVAAVACSGVPASAGVAAISRDTICYGGDVDLDLSSYPLELGLDFSWESAPAGSGNWSPLSGSSGYSYTATGLSANTDFRAVVTCTNPGGGTAYSNVVTVEVVNPLITASSGGTRCGVGTVSLSATGTAGTTVSWYAAASGGTVLDTGSTFTTPVIGATDTFYAAATVGSGVQPAGLANRVGATTNSGYSDIGLMFTALQPFVLNSVAVYPVGTGGNVTATIQLKNASGTVLETATVSLPTAASPGVKTVVPLHFNVPAGTDHRLVLSSATGGGISGFIREATTGFTYPYTLPGILSITSAYTGGASSSYYYYFYDWQVAAGCEGPRVPVVAAVTAPPAYTVSASSSSVCAGSTVTLTASSSHAYNFSWTPGGSGSSVTDMPDSTTMYYVTGTDANNCGVYDSVAVEVRKVPAAIAIVASPPAICMAGNVSLTLTDTIMNGIAIQWQKHTGSGFGNIAGATADTFSEPVTVTTIYKADFYCDNVLVASTPADTVSFSNPQITATYPGSSCSAGPVVLAATAEPGATINWYDVATGGTALGSGGVFVTPAITATTTYYAVAVAGSGTPDTLGVPLTNGGTTGVYNHMFLVHAHNSINLNSLAIKCNNSVNTMTAWDIYYRPDNYQNVSGGNTSSAGWTLISSTSNIPSQGATDYTEIATGLGISIPAGATYSFFIVPGAGTTHQYGTNGAGTTVASNADVEIKAGHRGSGLFSQTTSGGMATVRLGYYTGCEGVRVPVTATVNGAATGTGLASGGSITVENQADGSTVSYEDQCSEKIAAVTDASGGNVLGTTTAAVVTLPGVQVYGSTPYVPRIHDITPSSDGPGTVTIYALQSEFDAYNTYVTANNLNYPLLPVSGSDAAGMGNIVVSQFHGRYDTAGSGPLGLYDVNHVALIPNSSITAVSNGTYWTLTFPVSGFSGFFIHTGSTPLPIRLEGFTALYEGSRTRLQWHTSLEARGDYFEVERSLDGIGFERLGTVSGKGAAASYTYYDTHPVRGKNYYRLKLVEASGQSLYSAVREVVVKAGGEFSVRAYPNPVSDVLTVKAYGTEERRGTVTISDVTGKVMEVVPVTDGSVSVQMQGYAAGVYFIKYQDAGHSQTLKVTRR